MTMEEKLELLPEFLVLADVSRVPPMENGDGGAEFDAPEVEEVSDFVTQQVKCVPLLPVHNQFACLEVENENPPLPSLHAESPVKVTSKSKSTLTPHLLCLCQWEKHLPKQYVVVAASGPKSLVIKVEI